VKTPFWRTSNRPAYRVLTTRVLPRHLDLSLGFLYQMGFCSVEQKRTRGSYFLSVEIPSASSTADLLKRISRLQTISEREKIFRDARIRMLRPGPWAHNDLKYLQPFVLRLPKGRTSVPILTIDPRGGDIPPSPERDILYLEPSLAFGTGTHPSTQLTAELLGRVLTDRKKARVLDLGCGTGILAMIADRLKAAEIWAVDNDPTALTVAKRNFSRNRIRGIFLKDDLRAVKGRFDAVAANLLLKTLIQLKGDLIRRMKRNGFLIASGLLYRDVPTLLKAYREFHLLERKNKKGWSALLLKRNEFAFFKKKTPQSLVRSRRRRVS
jgi:ribosomal protein L11 methylase PrmA